MAKEYIEREAATAYAPLPKHLREYQTMNLDDARKEGYDFAIRQLSSIPAADVAPVVRGRWIYKHRHRGGFRVVTGEDEYGNQHTIQIDERYEIDEPYCSECGKLNEAYSLNFCPNCGADMREVQHDD